MNHSDRPGFPRAWIWKDDGDTIRGRYIEMTSAPDRDGRETAILGVEVDGEPRAVWLFNRVLRDVVAREVRRRPTGDLDPGELVTLRRLEKRTARSGNPYWPYEADFEHAPPKRSAREILGERTLFDDLPLAEPDDVHDDIPY